MGSKNKICSLFIVLALLFWNPLSFYFIYGNTVVYSFKLIHFFFWFALVTGTVSLYLLLKNKLSGWQVNTLFSLGMLGILFSLIVFVNGLIGFTGSVKRFNKAREAGLIFEPGSKVYYETPEFKYVVEINSVGLREREIPVEKSDKYRILCFGDSWTVGWGVNLENTWPAKLEQFLKAKGIRSAEVINCGRAGTFTSSYKKYIEKIVPLLKPDLVLLGVLQIDDLAQLYETNFPVPGEKKNNYIPAITKVKYALKTFLTYSVRNISTLVNKGKAPIMNIRKNWQNSVSTMIKNLSRIEYTRYWNLDDSVKALLQSGNLNPGLLYYYINSPDRTVIFNDPGNPATQFALSEMNKDIHAIKAVCNENHSGLVFINLPTNYFTGHRVTGTPDDILNTFYENNNHIDSLYRSVALKNDIPYFEMTAEFRALENKTAYFFRYDGHPNSTGYQKIAELIAEYLVANSRLLKSN